METPDLRRQPQASNDRHAPIRSFVERLKAELHTDCIPMPAGGGKGSRVLLVLNDPGPHGAQQTGLLSPWRNDDQTAKKLGAWMEVAGFRESDGLVEFWNAFNWPIEPGEREKEGPQQAGARHLEELIHLLRPELRLVVPMGRFAKIVLARVRGIPASMKHAGTEQPSRAKKEPTIAALRDAFRIATGTA